jgi:hypothetical protein
MVKISQPKFLFYFPVYPSFCYSRFGKPTLILKSVHNVLKVHRRRRKRRRNAAWIVAAVVVEGDPLACLIALALVLAGQPSA